MIYCLYFTLISSALVMVTSIVSCLILGIIPMSMMSVHILLMMLLMGALSYHIRDLADEEMNK